MIKQHSVTLEQIPAYAKQVASELKGGEILALVGPLGAGKTTFTKALGKNLKIKKTITSPTFILMNVFPIKMMGGNKTTPATLYHLDLYRTKNFREVKYLGITDLWGKPNTITVIEWADKIKKYLPKKTKLISFSPQTKN